VPLLRPQVPVCMPLTQMSLKLHACNIIVPFVDVVGNAHHGIRSATFMPLCRAAGQVLAADVLARQAAATVGCPTLTELAAIASVDADAADALRDSAASAHSPAAGGQPQAWPPGSAAAAGGSASLDLRQLEADAAAVAVCVQQLAATRRWASTKEGGLRVQYLHEKGG
jgi:hypothetical protein